jgi:hypothetical protein
VAAAALAVALLALWPSSPQRPVAPAPATPAGVVAVRQSLTPDAVLFGDRVTAELGVAALDPRVDVRSIRVETDFTPFTKVAERVSSPVEAGTESRAVTVTLACLTDACLVPRSGTRSFRFAPAVVTFRQGSGRRTLRLPWQELRVASRLTAGAMATDAAPQLGTGATVSPALLRTVLVAAAVTLALAGSWLLLTGLPPGLSRLRRRRRRTELERALEQLDAAVAAGDEGERRRALEHLAAQLERVDAPVLETESRRLAWDRTPPPDDELAALGAQVRAHANGGSP